MSGLLIFILCAALLVAGYFVYGRFAEKVYGLSDTMQMPSVVHPDGVDYSPMPTWKVFLIQLLNIAGLGPAMLCAAELKKTYPETFLCRPA